MEEHPFAILASATAEFLEISQEAAADLIKRGCLTITKYYGKGKGFSIEHYDINTTEAEEKLLEKVVNAVKGLSTDLFIPRYVNIDGKEAFGETMTDYINRYFEADDCLVHDDGHREKRIYEAWKFARFLKNRKDNSETPEYKFVSTIENHIEKFLTKVCEDSDTRDFQIEYLSEIMYSVECLHFNDFVTRFLKESLGFISYVDFAMIKNAKKTVHWMLRQKGIEETVDQYRYIIFVDEPKNQSENMNFCKFRSEALEYIIKRFDLPDILAIATEAFNGSDVIREILTKYLTSKSTSLNKFILKNTFMLFYSQTFSDEFFELCHKHNKEAFAKQVVDKAFEDLKRMTFPYTVMKNEIKWAIQNLKDNSKQTCFEKFIEENHVYIKEPIMSVEDNATKLVGLFKTDEEAQHFNDYRMKVFFASDERVARNFNKWFPGEAQKYFNEYFNKHLQELCEQFPNEDPDKIFDTAIDDAFEATCEHFTPLVNKKTAELPPEIKIYHLYGGAQMSIHEFANNQLLMRILKELDNDEYLKRHNRVNLSELIEFSDD